MNLRARYYLIGVFALLISCSSEDLSPSTKSNLVSSESVSSRSADELKNILASSGIELPLDELKYDVERFKIVYETTYLGETIQASALVILPKKVTESIPMISFQHGTIAAHSEAPTQVPGNDNQLLLYTALASPGFIAVIPDFIGFGASASIQHPYYVEDATASAIVDALRAAKQLASQKSIGFDSRVFLAGYSQGGYATMATHKFLEAQKPEGFDIVASFPASGGYDVKGMQEYFFDLESYDQPFYLAFVAQAYKTYYKWSDPLSDMFNEPYASRIPALVNGSKTSDEINSELTDNIAELLTTEILANIDTDTKYSRIVSAFNDNSLTDWTPVKPVYMYHGDADVTVPYSNSVATINKLKANGSTSVTLTVLTGADHSSGVVPYIEQFLPILFDLK